MVILKFRQVTRFSKETHLVTLEELCHNQLNKKRNTDSVKLGMFRTSQWKSLRAHKNIAHLTNDMQVTTKPTTRTGGAIFAVAQLAAQVIPVATLSLVASLASANFARYPATTSEVPPGPVTPRTQLPGSPVNELNSVLR